MGIPFEKWHREMQRRMACQRLKAKRLAASVSSGVVLVCERHNASAMGAFVHPSSEEPDMWRISYFDDLGFSGHTLRDTPEEAIELCLREQYRDTNRNLLREYSRKPKFYSTLPDRIAS